MPDEALYRDYLTAVSTDTMGWFVGQYGLGRLEYECGADQMLLYRMVAAAVLSGQVAQQGSEVAK